MFFLGDDVSSLMQVLECRIKILGVHASMYSNTDIACIVVVIIFLHCKKQEIPMPTVKEIHLIGLATIRSCKHESDSAQLEVFRRMYGISPYIAHTLYYKLCNIQYIRCEELFWALLFLRKYPTMDFLAEVVGKSENTIRLSVWKVISRIAELDLVSTSIFSM